MKDLQDPTLHCIVIYYHKGSLAFKVLPFGPPAACGSQCTSVSEDCWVPEDYSWIRLPGISFSAGFFRARFLLKSFEIWIGNLFLNPSKSLCVHVCVRARWDEDTQRNKTWIPVCLFASYALCVWLTGCAAVHTASAVCVCMDTQIAYLPRSGWLSWLVLGTGPDCPSANITRPKRTLSPSRRAQISTRTHKAPGNNAAQRLPMFPETLLTHRVFISTWCFFIYLFFLFSPQAVLSI